MNEEQHFPENKDKTKRHRQPKSLSQRLRDKQASLQKAEASLAQAQSRVDKLQAELEALENQRLRDSKFFINCYSNLNLFTSLVS